MEKSKWNKWSWLIWLSLFVAVNIVCGVVYCLLPASAYRDNLLGNEIATILGVIIGIPVGIGIYNYQQKLSSEELQKAKARRKRIYLKEVYLNLILNRTIIASIESGLDTGNVIYANVDVQLLESSSGIKHEILDDFALSGKLDSILSSLLHFHRLMDLQLQLAFDYFGRINSPQATHRERDDIIKAIREWTPTLMKKIDEVLPMIEPFCGPD